MGDVMSDLNLILEKYRNDNIALYGLSAETERVIKELDNQYNLVGLLDSFRENGKIYGKDIITLCEAAESKVKLIIVVARPGSCKAIARKIEKFCTENSIALYDIRGNDLTRKPEVTYKFNDIKGMTQGDILQLADQYNVVSVDLFDTLIMRKTLFSTDVIDIAYARLKENNIHIDNFSRRRLESEKYLSKSTAPTIVDIYSYMIEKYSIEGVTALQLADNEWKVDYDLVIPRKELCDVIDNIYKSGKDIYIISDTYYSKKQLKILLDKCNIHFYKDILASCEYKTSKTQHLFDVFLDSIKDRTCLHIGDDEIADIKSSEDAGIKSCRVYSGLDLMEQVGYLGLMDHTKDISDRIKIGHVVSCLFNSPFQFDENNNCIIVKDSFNLGYLFFAPIISGFTIWLKNQTLRYGLNNIWFCARDGYLIKKMYDILGTQQNDVYFLTSRTAAIRAGILDKRDIEYVEKMNFSGTIKEQLKKRFGINTSFTKDRLSDYSDEILQRSSVCRYGYKKYIDNLHMNEEDIAFFDFVAKGTCQMFVGNIIDEHLKGFYFLRLDESEMKDKNLDIVTFYDDCDKNKSEIYDNYYILETVLTSAMPSVEEFSALGEPVYAEETRTSGEIECFEHVQEGILDYFKSYINICPETERIENKNLDEIILSLIHKISVKDEEFLGFKVEDVFFNRMTDMTSLI